MRLADAELYETSRTTARPEECPRPAALQPKKLADACNRNILVIFILEVAKPSADLDESDDTSVAILEKQREPSACAGEPPVVLHFHERITAANVERRGIHPIAALDSHSRNLARLVDRSLQALPALSKTSPQKPQIGLKDGSLRSRPDFITVTRGPGMRSNISCGLDTAKGLSVAWQIPLLAVHHMQAHALTPRLVNAMSPRSSPTSTTSKPSFPFLSLLVSGGHTLLLHSKSITQHETLASTSDIAIGEALDKIGRLVLPASIQAGLNDVAYAKHLSNYAFPTQASFAEHYTPPFNRGAECIRTPTTYGWEIPTPFASTRELRFSFSGIASEVHRIFALRAADPCFGEEERLALARSALRVSFNHLASRTVMALEYLHATQRHMEAVKTLVVSGGVAANPFLKHLLRRFLDVRGFEAVELIAPPAELCTDNAAMIGWCGMEMWEAGWRSGLEVRSVRKWGMHSGGDGDSKGEGGILGLEGWYNVKDGGKESRYLCG